MTEQEVIDEFDRLMNGEGDFDAFEKIPNKLHPMRDVCGILFLASLFPEKGYIISAAEHDIVYYSVELEEFANIATKEDIAMLYACGIYYNETDGFFSYP